jgi:hypothetical protein
MRVDAEDAKEHFSGMGGCIRTTRPESHCRRSLLAFAVNHPAGRVHSSARVFLENKGLGTSLPGA